MLNLHVSLTSLAAILWSGMMIIAGSIWVLSSQVRKLSDLLERQANNPGEGHEPIRMPRLALGDAPMSLPRSRTALRVVERPSARAN